MVEDKSDIFYSSKKLRAPNCPHESISWVPGEIFGYCRTCDIRVIQEEEDES